MIRTKRQEIVPMASGATTTPVINLNGTVWFTIEVPDADKAKAITVQCNSKATGTPTWVSVLTIADITNRFKQLTAAELSAIGPLEEIRLVFATGVAAACNIVIHTST